MTSSASHATWIEIDPSAIESNARNIIKLTAVPLMAVVKANGYGHGSAAAARAALRGGASWCGVARASEALQLRRDGLAAPILLLGGTPTGSFAELVAADVSLAVWSPQQFEAASVAGRTVGKAARLHLKVDTGMSRIGVQPEEAIEAARRLAAMPDVTFEGVFTHFARADEDDGGDVQGEQERTFSQVVEGLASASLRPRWVHAANSAAALRRPHARFDLVRVGIALYGLEPSPACPLPEGFRTALSWRAQLSQVKTLPPGHGIGYGHAYITRETERIGTVPVGYADGFRRTEGNQVVVAGQVVPVVGRVCMDQVMVQLDRVPVARPGDVVTLIGEHDGARLTAEQVAQRWGTINYEVVCGIAARVPRMEV